VEVQDGSVSTVHVVTVPDDLLEELGCDRGDAEELVRESFGFLLEHEPPTSILRRFRLSQISDYFPQYPAEIRRRMDRGR